MSEISKDDLEQRCIEPGLWEIEGFQVRRLQTKVRRRVRWIIVWEHGISSEVVRSLDEARGKIVDRINLPDDSSV